MSTCQSMSSVLSLLIFTHQYRFHSGIRHGNDFRTAKLFAQHFMLGSQWSLQLGVCQAAVQCWLEWIQKLNGSHNPAPQQTVQLIAVIPFNIHSWHRNMNGIFITFSTDWPCPRQTAFCMVTTPLASRRCLHQRIHRTISTIADSLSSQTSHLLLHSEKELNYPEV